MEILTKETKGIKKGVYQIFFKFTTKGISGTVRDSLFINIDKEETIRSIELFLFNEVIETFKTQYSKENVKKDDVTERPEIENIYFRKEFYYVKP